MLRQTGLHEWTPIPLQYVSDDVEGCFVERDWWFRLKRWALNDNAPAVSAFVHRVHPLRKNTSISSSYWSRSGLPSKIVILHENVPFPMSLTP